MKKVFFIILLLFLIAGCKYRNTFVLSSSTAAAPVVPLFEYDIISLMFDGPLGAKTPFELETMCRELYPQLKGLYVINNCFYVYIPREVGIEIGR